MDELLSTSIVKLRDVAEDVTKTVIAPASARVDGDAAWPEHAFSALGDAGLLGLHVPKRLGGKEQGLLALAVIGETIAKGCASSALCYTMHCVGTAVIAAKATRYHEEKYLEPIAKNQHITSLALSEEGSGVHFYLPQTQLERTGEGFVVNGSKKFVTNGAHADSYVISTMISTPDAEGDFSCLVLDNDTEGMNWQEQWRGIGMRGNSSRGLTMSNVRIPLENLLGEEGDQIWYAFEVVAPYFMVAMAGTYIGIAQSAFDYTVAHLTQRQYQHSDSSLADLIQLQVRVAQMNQAIERSRCLLYQAAYLADVGNPKAAVQVMTAKADAAQTVVKICNEAMTCCGGQAYRENGQLARNLRDARAAHIMSPTTDMLHIWAGRLLLDLPML